MWSILCLPKIHVQTCLLPCKSYRWAPQEGDVLSSINARKWPFSPSNKWAWRDFIRHGQPYYCFYFILFLLGKRNRTLVGLCKAGPFMGSWAAQQTKGPLNCEKYLCGRRPPTFHFEKKSLKKRKYQIASTIHKMDLPFYILNCLKLILSSYMIPLPNFTFRLIMHSPLDWSCIHIWISFL